MLRLKGKLRLKLKSPLGELVTGTSRKTMGRLREIVGSERPTKLICIGDVVSRNAVKTGIDVDVAIIDSKKMRRKAEPLIFDFKHRFYLKNPPGKINLEAYETFMKAFKESKVLVFVEGEEDLLTLPAVDVASENSIVVYGQPKRGIVVVRVNEETRRKVRLIMNSMVHEE